MNVYADYDFYRDIYHGSMEEDDFNRYVLTASQYIRYLTMGASDKYEGDELRYAACSASDIYYAISTGKQKGVKSGVVKSENNDGYSATFVVEGTDGETKEDLAGRKIYSEIRKWLLPTGLLSRKVRCAHDHQCRHYTL